ncbi:DUF4238 domain-containing protein [Mesoplasma photuris]|uniref:DUF4238 domain-containing protein n=1 Tax=Mesoplasma photuris TaxID=217731 RepID=UPI0004E1FB67|nr:DUF4238 domain-containing protein [Mesoplasma photuris]
MKKNEIIVNQHFLPNFLIKRWRDNENKIYLIDNNGNKIVIDFSENKKYFSEKFLYEDSNFKENELENKLSKIEKKYSDLTNEIIRNLNLGKAMNEMGLVKNDIALIELFSKLQMWRNRDYWSIVKNDKKENIKYLNEIIDSYYSYTQMSDRNINLLEQEILRKINFLETIKYIIGFDSFEYQMHSLYSDPKYFLVHSIHITHEYNILQFHDNCLPISNLGQFKISDGLDKNYFYIIPISPNVAVFKKPHYFDLRSSFKLFEQKFYQNKEMYKGIIFNELLSFSKFSIISPEMINEDYKNKFEIYKNFNVTMRVMDSRSKSNKTIKKAK